MLLGWLFGGGLLVGGKTKSELNRIKAIENNKKLYTDVYGRQRYVDSGLLYSERYEELKNPNEMYYKSVRFWEDAYKKAKEKYGDDENIKKMYENKINEEKQKAEKMKKTFEKYDATAKNGLRKRGYKF